MKPYKTTIRIIFTRTYDTPRASAVFVADTALCLTSLIQPTSCLHSLVPSSRPSITVLVYELLLMLPRIISPISHMPFFITRLSNLCSLYPLHSFFYLTHTHCTYNIMLFIVFYVLFICIVLFCTDTLRLATWLQFLNRLQFLPSPRGQNTPSSQQNASHGKSRSHLTSSRRRITDARLYTVTSLSDITNAWFPALRNVRTYVRNIFKYIPQRPAFYAKCPDVQKRRATQKSFPFGRQPENFCAAYVIYLRQKCDCRRLSVCLSVCLLARFLKNAWIDLDEMLRVDRCRDMEELVNF